MGKGKVAPAPVMVVWAKVIEADALTVDWASVIGDTTEEALLRLGLATVGDVASVAAQYSYLSSPLTMFVDPYTGRETARALFREIYGYWHTLPRDKRPKLYLYGLSLGAQNSEWSFEFFELMGDPIDGALWVGPPWTARYWRAATEARNPGTPARC